MATYIVKRLLLIFPTLLGITAVTFLIVRLAPGDPAAAKLGQAGTQIDAGGGSASNREQLLIKAKVRLGLFAEEGTVRVWSAESDTTRARLGEYRDVEVRSLAYSPDGALLAVGRSDGRIDLYSANGDLARSLEAHSKAVVDVDFSSDGGRLASASEDNDAGITELESGETRLLEGHAFAVTSVAFSADDSMLATGSLDKTIRIWHVAGNFPPTILEGHTRAVSGLDFLSDGRLVSAARDRTLRVWEGELGAGTTRELGFTAPIASLAIRPDEAVAALGLNSNKIALVDLGQLEITGVLEGHAGEPLALAFNADGSRLVSGSFDKTVIVWNPETRDAERRLLGHSTRVRAIAVSSDGTISSGAFDANKVGLVPAYIEWMRRLAELDFGRSFKDDRPVWDKIFEALPVTLELNIIAFIVIYLFAIPLGVFSAIKRNTLGDSATTLVLFLLYSMPSFWVATMLVIFFGSPAGPTGGILPFTNLHGPDSRWLPFLDYLRDHIAHLVLPIVALVYASFAFLSRLVRASMLEVLSQDYVRTARAKGLPELDVVRTHALRNALMPVVTIFGNLLPAMIGGSIIIEQIFSLPGMGSLGFEAITQRDYPVIMAITTLVAVLTMIGILISDLLYCIVDPRVKLQ